MKKVLIITYYWPPAGGPGVQRWLKFVKYLRDFDVEPVVYIPENPSYPIIDNSLEDQVPGNIKIIKKEIFEPYSIAEIFSKKDTETISSGIISKEENQSALQKTMLFIRGNFFIPDARKFWIKPSVKFLEKELKNDDYHAIITTGPPHSLHLIGLKLKKDLDLKWIADFRDPWTQIGYHEKLKLTETARKKHESLESEVLNTADHIITTSFTTRDEFTSKTQKPISVITNGYDIDVNEKPINSSGFKIAHVGSLLSGRNPIVLWKVIAELVTEDEEFKNHFSLILAGKISEEVEESIIEYGLQSFLKKEGYVNHSQAVQIQRDSSLLLLIEIDSEETRGIIPGKLFEYLSSRKPILAIGPEKWDAERIIKETNSGEVFKYQDQDQIKSFIKKEFSRYKNGSELNSAGNISKYHRKSLTRHLAEVINNI